MLRRPEDPGPGRARARGARGSGGWPGTRDGRRGVLAVWLATVIVVSLLFVPGAGAVTDGGPSVDAPDRGEGPSSSGGPDDSGPPGQERAGGSGGNPDPGNEGSDTSVERGGPPDKAKDGGSDKSRDHDPTDGSQAGGNQEDEAAPSDEPDGTNVTATDVEAGETVTMDVSEETTDSGDVTVDTVSGTSTTSGDVTLTAVIGDDSTTTSTTFDTDDGAEEVGRFHLSSDGGEQSLEDVSVTFEVSKQHLTAMDADPGSINLYAYIDGEWVALETEAVGETASGYLFSADSPHLSEFAVGALSPAYEVWSAAVDDRTIAAGEEATASARVSNVGAADGVFVAELVADGRTVATRQLTVAGGGTRQATLRWTPDAPGTYQLAVNGVPAGTVTVTAADEPEGGTVLAQLAGWVADLAPASALEWADRNGRYAVIGPVPGIVTLLFG